MAQALSRLERVYLQKQPLGTFRTIPNTTGTATVTDTDVSAHIQARMTASPELLTRRDKTGTRTARQGIPGRSAGEWSLSQSLAGGDVPGAVPDADPLLVAVFGADATVDAGTAMTITSSTNAAPVVMTLGAGHGLADGGVVRVDGHDNEGANGVWVVTVSGNDVTLLGSTGTSLGTSAGTIVNQRVIYSLSDDILTFVDWSFRTPASLEQRVSFGNTVETTQFNLGDNAPAEWEASGASIFVLDSKHFATATVEEKGGLTSFPSEPASPVSNGDAAEAFTGRVVIDGNTIVGIRRAQLTVGPANEIITDTFGSRYGDGVQGDVRNIAITFSLYDDDTAAVDAMKEASLTKAPLRWVMQVGTQPGNTWVFDMQGVQLGRRALTDDDLRYSIDFDESRAHGTVSGLNELKLTII